MQQRSGSASRFARRVRLAVLGCVLAAATAGCGQKGPLYQPEDEAEEEKQAAGSSVPRANRHGG